MSKAPRWTEEEFGHYLRQRSVSDAHSEAKQVSKKHKYNAEPTMYDGIRFDSRAECRRYQQLLYLQQSGEIRGVQLQPSYELVPAFTDSAGIKRRGIVYRGDFSYRDQYGRLVVEDVKGMITPVFRLKQKLFLWKYPDIELRIVSEKEP